MDKSKDNNLVLKELIILNKMIKVVNGEVIQWLDTFLGCIPHSTYDETYEVFSHLFTKAIKELNHNENRTKMFNKIVKMLFNQYTVKGKAYQEAKEGIITSILEKSPPLII